LEAFWGDEVESLLFWTGWLPVLRTNLYLELQEKQIKYDQTSKQVEVAEIGGRLKEISTNVKYDGWTMPR
jgi:hypothetical protein